VTDRFIDKAARWTGSKSSTESLFPTEEFLTSLNLIVGLDQLLDNLSAKLRETLDAKTVYIIMLEPITNRYVGKRAKGINASLLAEFNFSHADNLIKWLTVNRCPLDTLRETEVVKFLSSYEQDLLRSTGIVLIVPLIAVNRLTGALFLTEKAGGRLYQPGELDSLRLLTNHVALAIEHALMHQFQEDRLRKIFHADRLATVGELAAGAAHEIKNPLTSIRSTAQYIKKDLPSDKQSLADGIIEEVDRIDEIIRGLLSLSKSSELHISLIDFHENIQQTLALLESELKRHDITLHKHNELSDSKIDADPFQLKQLLLNIFLNSIQAMPNGGAITYTLSHIRQKRRDSAQNGFVQLAITDTGVGIPSDKLPKVFDPFYTTKENGTGLGLSISYGIVSRHGGEIEIESSTEGQNRGTTVTIYLPRKATYRTAHS
jgi:signal transduction histidine kinase